MCCRYGSGLHSHPVCTCLVDRHTKKCFIRPQKTLAVPPNFRHQHPTHCRIYRFHQRLLPLPPDCTLCPRQEPACVQPTARNLSWTSASTSSLLQHQSSRPTASPTHGRIPFFHVRPPCDTDLSNIKKDVPALRSRSKNKGRASPVPHKPTTRYPGHAHSHVRLHLDNNSILHHQRYLGQPFSSHPSEPQLGRPLATSIRHLAPIVHVSSRWSPEFEP